MSITLESLKTKKKNELKDIAQELGLNTKGLRWELEDRIRTHLIESKHEEESIVDGASSNTPARRPNRKSSTSSNRPKSRKSSPNGGERVSEEESEASEVEIKQETANARYRTLPNDTDLEEASIHRGLPRENVIKFDVLKDYLLRLRKECSNTRTFVQCIVFFELGVFLYCAIEWNLKIATVPIPSFSKEIKDAQSFDLHGPDVFVIIEWHRFWRPLLSFLFYLLAIPLLFSCVFNLDPQRHSFSPLAFSVAQCGIFLATIGHFDWVEDVRDFIPENLIYAGSGAGIIFSLYESILLAL